MSRPKGQQFPHRCTAWANGREKSTGLRRTLSKELHHGLEIDRTSCTSFLANQLRVLLTAAAYVLMQELRLSARGSECASAQVCTLRERFLKLGVWVERSAPPGDIHSSTPATTKIVHVA